MSDQEQDPRKQDEQAAQGEPMNGRESERLYEQEEVPEVPADAPEAEEAEETEPAADPVTQLQQERDELWARLQRLSADYQNYMKRSQQNLTSTLEIEKGDLLKTFIPVLDHFDRALEGTTVTEGNQGLYDGIRMVRDELLKVMGQAGVERIEVEPGEEFDPHRHEAMLRQPVEGVKPGQVSIPLQPGYVYQGRTLRAAKVAVAPQ